MNPTSKISSSYRSGT